MFRAIQTILILFAVAVPVRALETDQFTVPPRPLKDCGPDLKAKVDGAIDDAVARTNGAFAAEIRSAADSPFEFFRDRHIAKASEQLAEGTIAGRLRAAFAVGLPECTIERHVHRTADAVEISPGAGVFGRWLLDRPVTLMELSPTVNCYGVYLGTDKIGHFFQQGHEYYAIVLREQQAGLTFAQAVYSAVDHGVRQEKGFYGEAMVGSFSNADLAADYAGMKFYLNLTRAVTVGGVTRPPILVRVGTKWQRNPAVTDDYLRPFFSDHFNEARNPSRYVPNLRAAVRDNVRERAAAWLKFYGSTAEAEARRTRELATWHGEDYGHSGFDRVVTLPGALLSDSAQAAR